MKIKNSTASLTFFKFIRGIIFGLMVTIFASTTFAITSSEPLDGFRNYSQDMRYDLRVVDLQNEILRLYPFVASVEIFSIRHTANYLFQKFITFGRFNGARRTLTFQVVDRNGMPDQVSCYLTWHIQFSEQQSQARSKIHNCSSGIFEFPDNDINLNFRFREYEIRNYQMSYNR